MAKPLRPKRGTTAKNDAFTGLASEITIDTEKHSIRVHDGVTAGGHEILPKEQNDELYAPSSLTIGESKPFGSYDGVDLNTMVNAGIYCVGAGSTALNFPTGTNGVLVVYSGLNKSLSGPFVRQVFYRIGTVDTNDFEVFTRTIQIDGSNKSYGKWYQVLTSAGGTFTGDLSASNETFRVSKTTNTGLMAIYGGVDHRNGAFVAVHGMSHVGFEGEIELRAFDGTSGYTMWAKPDGSLTWAGRNLSSFAIPSGSYTSLTFGASNTSYTAPSDGWVQARMSGNVVGQYLMLIASNGLESAQFVVNNANATTMCRATVPVKKGDTVTLSYTCNGTNGRIRFYPVNGVI